MRPWMMALVLGLGTFALVITQQRDVGITRDETIYFAAGDRYVDWWFDLAHGGGSPASARINASSSCEGRRRHSFHDRLLNRSRHVFTAIRVLHFDGSSSSSVCLAVSARCAFRKQSCAAMSASSASCSIRRHNRYTRFCSRPTQESNSRRRSAAACGTLVLLLSTPR